MSDYPEDKEQVPQLQWLEDVLDTLFRAAWKRFLALFRFNR